MPFPASVAVTVLEEKELVPPAAVKVIVSPPEVRALPKESRVVSVMVEV